MDGNISIILKAIREKGLLETFVHILKVVFNKLYSLSKICWLRLRSYDICYSVKLGGNNDFFQSTKHAISIRDRVRLGKGTRIHSGFGGKIHIGENVLLDDYCYVSDQKSIKIGNNVTIAAFCYITDFNHRFGEKDKSVLEQGYDRKPVVIEDSVWLGTHVIILPGVTIGKGAVIGAGSVVTKDVSPYTVNVGNPATVVKKLS